MCLAVPGKILSIDDSGPMRMSRAAFAGVVREVSLALTPEAKTGDYVLVHAGFAISRLDEAAARRSLDTLNELADDLSGIAAASGADR